YRVSGAARRTPGLQFRRRPSAGTRVEPADGYSFALVLGSPRVLDQQHPPHMLGRGGLMLAHMEPLLSKRVYRWSSRPLTCSHENSMARSTPRCPMAWARSGSISMETTAAAMAGGSDGGTSRAVSPSTTTSGIPP